MKELNYWNEAQDILKNVIDEKKIQEVVKKYYKNNKLSNNEILLFNHMTTSYFEHILTMSKLYSDCDKQKGSENQIELFIETT